MTDLTSITALGEQGARSEDFGVLQIAENTNLALASLALRAGQVMPAPFGLTLPETGKWIAQDGTAAFWVGPGQWMIEADGRADEDFAAILKDEVPGCSVTEQTDGWVCFEVTAQSAGSIEALMEKLVNLDPVRLSPGAAVRTGLEHMSVYLVRRSETRVAVLGMRTLADALWHAIATVATRVARTT